MRLRRLALPLAGALGAAVAVVPALATGSPSTSASFKAVDFAWQANGGAGTKVTIAQGGTVTFSYPTGLSEHNADFGRGLKPSGCAQMAGPSSGTVPPLPHQPTSSGWSGTCTFNTPGTYTFHCDEHQFMTAMIVVEGSGTSTTTTTTPGGSPLAGPAAKAVSVRFRQRGNIVHGSVKVSQAGAGGRLEVDLRASARSLGRRGHEKIRVGRLIKKGLKSGKVRFAVGLDAAAKRALRAHGRLALTVRVIVRSASGRSGAASRRVLVRP